VVISIFKAKESRQSEFEFVPDDHFLSLIDNYIRYCLLRGLKNAYEQLYSMIGAEATRLLRDIEVTGDPAGAFSAEEAPGPPRGKRVPGAEIIRQLIEIIKDCREKYLFLDNLKSKGDSLAFPSY
jgi:hypothetical protein